MSDNNIIQKQKSISVQGTVLRKADFRRTADTIFDNKKIDNLLDIKVEVGTNKDLTDLVVTVYVDYKQVNKSTPTAEPQVTANIEYQSVFKVIGDFTKEELDLFGRVNGGALVYPYIRELIASLSRRASVAEIVLPLFDFTQLENQPKGEKKEFQ